MIPKWFVMVMVIRIEGGRSTPSRHVSLTGGRMHALACVRQEDCEVDFPNCVFASFRREAYVKLAEDVSGYGWLYLRGAMSMSTVGLKSLSAVFAQIQDHRDPRGVRHPLPSLLGLVFLGLLARIREMAVLQRWAEMHWPQL